MRNGALALGARGVEVVVMGKSRAVLAALCTGLLVGVLSTASMLYAQSKGAPPPEPSASVLAPFDIIDTPGSTYLLNRRTGQVWRLGFTEVGGDRYWFGTHVPVQQPGTFEEFQQRLRRQIDSGK